MSIVQNINATADIAELQRIQRNSGTYNLRGASSAFSILTDTGVATVAESFKTVTGSKLIRTDHNNETCFTWNGSSSAGNDFTMTCSVAGIYRVWIQGSWFFSASTEAHNFESWLVSSKEGILQTQGAGIFQFAPDGNNFLNMNLVVDCDVGTTLIPTWESDDSVNVNFRSINCGYQAIQ